jgi:hypothetical protein
MFSVPNTLKTANDKVLKSTSLHPPFLQYFQGKVKWHKLEKLSKRRTNDDERLEDLRLVLMKI